MKNPDSVLAKVPQKKCDFRYTDLNYPAASGSFISFVSGGLLIPPRLTWISGRHDLSGRPSRARKASGLGAGQPEQQSAVQ